MNTTTFIEHVESTYKKKKCEYIEAVIIVCEQFGLDIEAAAFLIKKDSALKAKIQSEAKSLNILKRSAKLPI